MTQADVVTREQAMGLGLSRHTLSRLVAQEHWQRLAPGVFLAHSGATSWSSLAWAGILIGGEGSRLGCLAAGYPGRLVDQAPTPVHVFVPHENSPRVRGDWTFVRERAGARSHRCCGSPPRTLITDTVLDLCEDSSARAVEDWVTRAVQRRLTTPAHLARALAARRRHRQRRLLDDLLVDVAVGAESPLELRYLRDVERRHRLPDGSRQLPSPDRAAVRDILYEKFGVLVELDGRRGHEGEGAFRDMRRDNAALRSRLGTLRYGYGDVYGRPCAVAWEVGTVLTTAGWTGTFRRCTACPAGLGAI